MPPCLQLSTRLAKPPAAEPAEQLAPELPDEGTPDAVPESACLLADGSIAANVSFYDFAAQPTSQQALSAGTGVQVQKRLPESPIRKNEAVTGCPTAI